MNSLLKSLAPLAMLASAAFGAQAADFPAKDKPITIVVPFAAGGPDRPGRARPGRSHAQAAGRRRPSWSTTPPAPAARSAPTRWPRPRRTATRCCCTTSAWPRSPALYRNLPFKTLDDFEYLGMVNDVPMTLIGRPTLPANNFAELRTWLNANKGKVNLANAGLGAASHLCGLLFMDAMKFDMTTVPYKGTGPAMTDLIGGQVDLMCDQTTNTTGQIEAKKVKAFAVTTPKRLTTPALKDLPTLQEVGPEGLPGDDLARPVCAQGHARRRR